MGLLQRYLNYSEAIRVGPKSNLIGVLVEEIWSHRRDTGDTCTQRKYHMEEDSARRWSNASQGKRPQ